jgi:hypothetical protein
MGVQTIEACPFLDEDERVGCLDSLVEDVALAGVLGARWRRDGIKECKPALARLRLDNGACVQDDHSALLRSAGWLGARLYTWVRVRRQHARVASVV